MEGMEGNKRETKRAKIMKRNEGEKNWRDGGKQRKTMSENNEKETKENRSGRETEGRLSEK